MDLPSTRSTRAYTSPWPSPIDSTSHTLRKHHSAYTLSILPPNTPPLRHLVHLDSFASTDTNQPRNRLLSTATTSSEPLAPRSEPSRKSSGDALSLKSRTSSLAKTIYTGPVEEVTPWELHPVPTSPSSSSKTLTQRISTSSTYPKNNKSSSTPHIPLSPPPPPLHKSMLMSTGPVEEVTPWELLPGPSHLDGKPVSPISVKQSPVVPALSPPPTRSLSNGSVPVYPRTTPTGPTEDVTPWELTPVPPESQELIVPPLAASSRTMSSLSLAQLEQVTPWELYPAPSSTGSNLSGQTQVPVSTSSNSTKNLSEPGHRPRRSTGSKGSKAARSSIPATGILNIPIESTAFIATQQKGVSPSGTTSAVANVGSSPTTLPPGSTSGFHDPKQHDGQDIKFSTADRTILKQLKMSIRAREAQFVVKGVGNLAVGGGRSPGKKHHSYPANEVPYPRSYEREVVDLDVWETMFCLDICKGLTWHVFETPPTRVLELGCGTGTWILQSAQNWKECHFVGLDIVPLHPDLQNVGSPDLASRITWVQHNFLDGLPFQNEEFDFVHIKRIALGVPEDKWDKFFEEIARVMKPGAAFEMVEEDLFFPGKHIDDNEESLIMMDDDSLSCITDWNSTLTDRRNRFPTHDEEGSPATPTTSTTLLPRTPSRSNSPARSPARKENGKEVMINEEQISYDSFPSPSLPALSVPTTIAPTNTTPTPFLTTQKESNPTLSQHQSISRPSPWVQAEQSIVTGTIPAAFGSSSLSLFLSIGTVNDISASRTRSSSVQNSNTTESKPGASSLSLATLTDNEPKPTAKPSPFLSMLTQTPTNPRDHTLLETIWNEMLSSRWVNLSPLSLLKTYLEWHFKDVRTHPPFMYTFPPTAPKPEPAEDDSDSDSDNNNSPNLASLHPKSPPIKSNNSVGSHSSKPAEGRSWLSQQSLQQQSSPYVTLDETRGNAYSPSQQAGLSVSKAREANTLAAKRMSRLPTTALNVDLRTLNLHLQLRAKEILACSESMWEWVEEFQRTSQTSIPPLNAPSNWPSDVIRCAILEMTRDDFDLLLNNFTLDFQDRAAVGRILEEQFSWHVFRTRRLQDRRIFDKACKKYQKWVLAERMKSADHKPNGVITNTRNSVSTPNINPSSHYSSTAITRSHSSPQAAFENTKNDVQVSSHPSGPVVWPSPLCPTELMPTQRLSRSMRVFIAWKAGS